MAQIMHCIINKKSKYGTNSTANTAYSIKTAITLAVIFNPITTIFLRGNSFVILS